MKNSFTARAIAGLIVGGALALAAAGTANAASDGIQSTIYGNPAKEAQWWMQQSEGDCGPVSVAVVVGEVTGNQPTELSIASLAEKTPSQNPGKRGKPIYTPAKTTNDPNGSSGTGPVDLMQLLALYKLHPTMQRNVTQHGLEQLLAQGHPVIAEVNAGINLGKLDPGEDPSKPDHVLVVIGIDPTAGIVYLNDGSNPHGRNEAVPIERFMKAWATSGDLVISTEETVQ